jgi:GT2 family glycosyltransferase/glycosyltransferase involved in cell wall biosynthesis
MPVSNIQWRLQRLRYLLHRVKGSFAQRGMHGTLARIAQEFKRHPEQDQSLRLEPLDLPFVPFALPLDELPIVSIIIPIHNKLQWTLACLRSIARHASKATVEIIVIDDASTDGSSEVLEQVHGLRLIRNVENLGFIGSCNAGAAEARGRFLLFLNNDTQVTDDWLDALLQAHADEPDCGIVGSRLVYPDGRLQEAGGLVYADASAWTVGRFERRDDPRYLYRRDVDYVSGASLLIERDLYNQIGGFDTRYAPAYCEDMDLAFAVRAANKRVVYEPGSVVVHCEGISSGLDPFAGVKQYQTVNRAKFIEKWGKTLEQQPAPGTPVEKALHHSGAPHIFIMDALTPDPTRDAGSQQLYNIMRLLRSMGWRVTFMADNRQSSEKEIKMLGQLGVETLCKPSSPSLVDWLKREGRALNAVMLCRYYVADSNLSLVQQLAPQAKRLYDTVDLHFLREQRAAEHTGNATLVRQASASKQREFAVIRACDATFVVSTVEQELLLRELPGANVLLLPNMHEVKGSQRPFAERRDLVFVGGAGHPPNVDAVQWLVSDIWPRIHQQRPELTLHLVGDMPEAERQRLSVNGIVAHGRVESLTEWMDGCRIALAPLRYGAGVKGKVNTAMSHGLPVVATSIAAEGMRLEHESNVLLADDAERFAAEVLRLYDDEALWNRLSAASAAHVQRHFSFGMAQATLETALGLGKLNKIG